MQLLNVFCGAVAAGIILLLTVPGCGSGASTDGLLESAYHAGAQGNYEQQLEFANDAVAKAPENASALMLQALALYRLNQWEKAIEVARHAAELHPSDFTAQYLLGRLYAVQPGKAAEAIAALKNARRVNPNAESGKVLLLLAQCSALIDGNVAMRYYDAVPEPYQSSATVLNERAVIYAKNHFENDAAVYFRQALKAAPQNPHILLNLARFSDYYFPAQTADFQRAAQAAAVNMYRKYLEVTKGNPESAAMNSIVEARIQQLTRPNGR